MQAVEISATQVGVVPQCCGCDFSGIDAIIIDLCPSQKNHKL